MARVLLVNPPFYRLLGSHYNANSLGIAYIASFLNERGHDAWLYNADFQNENSYKKLSGIFTEFENYKNYFEDINNPIWHEVAEKITAFDPDWVGYTSYTANIKSIEIISQLVHRLSPKAKQVIGGVHATLDNHVLLKLPNVDYSVKREGEFAMLGLVEGKDPNKISGVVTQSAIRRDTFVEDADVNRDIDDLPFPERDKFWGISKEEVVNVDVSYICTIRGCPYRCNYCASPFHWKRDKVQMRSPSSVLAEMHHLKDNYWQQSSQFDYSASANTKKKDQLIIPDNTMVYFVDDVFTVKKRRVKEILRGIINEDLNMPWKCEARTDHLDEEICELMRKAGCRRVKLGFESGSDRILKQIQKDETRAEMLKGANMLKEAGVPFTAYFMAGFPGETDDDLKQTINFAQEIDADYYSLSVLAPYYGTKIYDDLVADGLELDKMPWEYFYHQTGELLANNTISSGVLQEYLNLDQVNNRNKGYE